MLISFNDDVSDDLKKSLLSETVSTSGTTTDKELCAAFITCSQIVFKRFIRASLDGQRRRDQVLELAYKLSDEIKNVEHDVDQTFSDDDGGYHAQNAIILGRYRVTDEHMHSVGILIRKRAFNFENDPPTLVDTDSRIYGKINIRSSQTFIPEFSLGVYFTNFFYPIFGTKTLTAEQATKLNTATTPKSVSYVAGQTVVDDVVDQQVPVVAAGMLNLTLNAFNGLAHPFLQVGVGTGKALPSFLAGGGIRLRSKVPIMLSLGAIWNWKKQFITLAVNQVIAGQAELERDLQTILDPKPRFYIGIQMHL